MTSPLPIDDSDPAWRGKEGRGEERKALSPSAIVASLYEEHGEAERLMTNSPHSVSLSSQGFHIDYHPYLCVIQPGFTQ